MSDTWYKFTLTLNKDYPKLSIIRFPVDPEGRTNTSNSIHNYLINLGLTKTQYSKDKDHEVVYSFDLNQSSYQYTNKELVNSLEKLYEKFEEASAKIRYSQGNVAANLIGGTVSRAEFEQLKKLSKIITNELQELEKDYQIKEEEFSSLKETFENTRTFHVKN